MIRIYLDESRKRYRKIYIEDIESGNSFTVEYVQNGQRKTMQLIDGKLYEMETEQIDKEKDGTDNNEGR